MRCRSVDFVNNATVECGVNSVTYVQIVVVCVNYM